MAEYGKLTVKKLKNELRRRGAVTSGRNVDLIERLESYDRNENFSNVLSEPVPAPCPVIWPTSGYKQITVQLQSDIPAVSEDSIREYFILRTAIDLQQAGDVQALRKGHLLLESKRVEACSLLASDDGTAVYFTGIVKAAMKKKVAYNVKLKVDSAVGDILNSDCECPAGKGPHGTCKHVAAMLGMLQVFHSTGDLLCRKSCTDQLQTFHHPRQVYDGSPVKVKNIITKHKRPTAGEDDDPRPVKYRNWGGYNDFVASAVTNYCSYSGKDLAFRYIMPTADLQAAVIDHDYTKLPFAQYWVDRANYVTAEQVSQIEQQTRTQSLSRKWFSERAWRVTASRFGDVLKSTCRRNMDKLCQSMVDPQQLHCRSVVHGRKYERAALQSFAASTGKEVTSCGLFVSAEHPFLAASPDGLVGDSHTIEVKCPLRGYGKVVCADSCFQFLSHDKSDNKLHLKQDSKYFMQVQGQLGVTGRAACYFVVYTGVDLFIEQIAFQPQYWSSSMVPRLHLFYEKHLRPFIAKRL